MRYLFGFICVLALGVMPLVGCADDGGGGGTGGGGAGGNGGVGGGVDVCEGLDDRTPCRMGDSDGFCLREACVPTDCSELEDGTDCWRDLGDDIDPGVCENGECKEGVTDCSDIESGTACVVADTRGSCWAGACFPFECDGLEDETPCWVPSDGPSMEFGLCLGGECLELGVVKSTQD